MNQLTREWIAKAEGNFAAAQTLFPSRRANVADGIAFHSQQSIEKYLSARSHEADLTVGRSHDLVELVEQLQTIEPLWFSYCDAFAGISDYAIRFRYPRPIRNPSGGPAGIQHRKILPHRSPSLAGPQINFP